MIVIETSQKSRNKKSFGNQTTLHIHHKTKRQHHCGNQMKTLIKLLPNPHLILQKSSWKQTETEQNEYTNQAKLKTLKKPI